MKIGIIGGGNIGTQFAIHCVAKEHKTYVLTSKPELFSDELQILNEQDNIVLTGKGIIPTSSYEEVCRHTDIIFVTYPAPLMEKAAEFIYQYVEKGTTIGLIPGSGGSECPFQKCILKGCVVFGLQRVPSVSRLIEYGKKVRCTGYRDCLYLASIPHIYTDNCCTIIQNIFDMQCHPLPNYLNVTLTPSNPILHTTRLYSIFRNYNDGMGYNSLPLFYEEWSNEASEILLKCDSEVQEICRILQNRFDLSFVKSLKQHYESNTPEEMTKKIRSIKGFKRIPTPSIRIKNKLYPDFQSRYFSADFPFGLEIIVQIATIASVNVPTCKKILQWYYRIAGKNNYFSYKKYINNIQDFEKFYMQ